MDDAIKNLSHIRKVFINLNLTKNYFNKIDNYKDFINLYESLFLQLKSNKFDAIRTMKEAESECSVYFGSPSMIEFNIEDFSCEFIYVLKDLLHLAKQILNNNIGYSIKFDSDLINESFFKDLFVTNIFINDNKFNDYDYWVNQLQKFNVLVLSYNKNKNEIYGISEYADSIIVKLNYEYSNENNTTIRKVACPEPKYYINVCNDGTITPCRKITGEKYHKHILGNIKDDLIIDIYYSKKSNVFKKIMRENGLNYPEPCKHCVSCCNTYKDIFNTIVVPD